MNEEQTISSSCQQDIGSNGRKEDIICWYDLLILHIHLSTADILQTIIMVFVVVCGMLPLVFALSSTKLSIFTLVNLVLLATFTVTSRGRKIQLTSYQAEINGDFADLDLANDSAVGWYQDQ